MIVILLCVLAMAFASSDLPVFEPDRDPGGCALDRITVEEGVTSYQRDSLSPDGRTIAIGWYRGEEARGTYLLDLRTGERTDMPEFNDGATFSPDGRMLLNAVYVDDGKTDIIEMDLDTREVSVIAQHEEWDWLPCYSPDGSQIVFNSYRTGRSDIYLYDRASGDLRRLTDTDMYEAHAQFSPDGKRIVFHRQVGESDFNIYILNLASGDETQITDSPREESYPSWSRDGRHIFFSSDEGNEIGKTNIVVMTADGDVVRRLTDHPEKDAYAFASPDGRYVYFNSYRDPPGVYRIELDDELGCAERAE